jgi:glycosyltransferase involved in cell wall biosynthesis
MNKVQQICRPITRKNINILSQSVHETAETNFSHTGYNVYALKTNTSRIWNETFRPIPPHYHQLTQNNYIPPTLDIDLVISHTKFSQFQELSPIAKQFGVNLLSFEHTTCFREYWSQSMINSLTSMRGEINAFISDYSVENWGYSHNDSSIRVIRHGIETDIFCPGDKQRKNAVLTVANDYLNRRAIIGYDDMCEITKGYEVKIVGHTKGLSEPAKNVNDLVNYYQTHRIFINSARLSPIPMSLLEAAACSCSLVSVRACGVPEYFTDKKDILFYDTLEQGKKHIRDLSNDEAMSKELGAAARKTIVEKFNINQLVATWKKVIGELI